MRNEADAKTEKTPTKNQSRGRSRKGTGTMGEASRRVSSGSAGEVDMRGIVQM
jgi:hypothetical protein